ncbi:zinc-binding alcohol dehydrogenase family protein [Paramixta manurensis]|uniref:Zinc-binding alcohol dehydrogenase family protein n=1 Tax=Paramixta manurensis TaxID=2740817 RepID=A0A6M8U8U7_9GAMM|nr:zinc-binding alcohol dehydrogenase family protein [Erwiniaceae bacterium PD-1]
MKAAIVATPGETPFYGDFALPSAGENQQQIKVSAAAISHVVKSRASGNHYSFDGVYPFVVGIDGVGTLTDGRAVWFAFPPSPLGAMAQFTVVDNANIILLPENLDPARAAAMANPGMSAWASLVFRAGLQPGERVLINGATGSAGKLAVQIARYLGAKKIIATGRNIAVLQSLDVDATVQLSEDPGALKQQFATLAAERIDVVVDYLWGDSALMILTALAKSRAGDYPMRYVQTGSLTGDTLALPSSLLRSAPIQLMGSGIGSLPLSQLIAATQQMFAAALPGQLTIDYTPVPLRDVKEAWDKDDSKKRTVFLIE